MSGSISEGGVTRIVTALQELVKASYLLGQIVKGGVQTNSSLSSFTVAGLPAAAPAGAMVYASNGRGPGEGAAAGTGTVVVGNGTIWRAVWSGVAVTV